MFEESTKRAEQTRLEAGRQAGGRTTAKKEALAAAASHFSQSQPEPLGQPEPLECGLLSVSPSLRMFIGSLLKDELVAWYATYCWAAGRPTVNLTYSRLSGVGYDNFDSRNVALELCNSVNNLEPRNARARPESGS